MTTALKQWKPSVFNIFAASDGKNLLFNSVSSTILALNNRHLPILKGWLHEIEETGDCATERALHGLIASGFVVPRGEDEYAREHRKFLTTQARRDTLFLTIVPTMACNLHCTYCFQQNIPHGRSMSPDTQDGIIEFVRRKAGESKALVVQWFGGEPLLRFDTIRTLSNAFLNICTEAGLAYHAEMLTNGLLLTPSIIAELATLRIRAIQVPLDGNPTTYARRKQIPLEQAAAYYRFLLEHMTALVEATGSVTIRINIDRENADEAKAVVARFKQHGVIDPRIDFRLGFLNTSRGILDCIPHDCLSDNEFADLELDFRRFLAAEGYRVYGRPGPREYPCTAAVWNAYTIDPEGRIGKCVPSTSTSETRFSRIYAHEIAQTLRETSVEGPYGDFDPFVSATCQGCPLLPACLGSCPKMHTPDHRLICSMKVDLGNMLAFYHQYDRNNRVHEES
ncbi:MAG: radical SAM protein [Oscillochloris sp.]|nr:radical SAM protein [Oscillochloris sp.]